MYLVWIDRSMNGRTIGRQRGSRVVSAIASCARGPGFDPRRRRRKICWSEHASLRVICRNDMIQCAVLRIGTLSGGPLCRDSHLLCRLKIPTQVLSHACRLILQTHRSVQCTPPKNNQKLIDGSNKKTKSMWVDGW